MQVIPVLDLLDGHVVRAQRGERTAYRPIRSTLTGTSEPLAVARSLIAATAARVLYVADLGAILARGPHHAELAALRAALPEIEIWLDAGYADYRSMHATIKQIEHTDVPAHMSRTHAAEDAKANIKANPKPHTGSPRATLVPVFGSESLRDPNALRDAQAAGFSPILSLDRRAGHLIAEPSLAQASDIWPSRVIAMTLDQVGSYEGPDLATIADLRARARPGTEIVGAGGIRHQADLDAAAAAGASAWLVASALHDGRLDGRPKLTASLHA
jgi:phosphoribosylformimino-5-aminoimidazole carboxamide ribotide isomerase